MKKKVKKVDRRLVFKFTQIGKTRLVLEALSGIRSFGEHLSAFANATIFSSAILHSADRSGLTPYQVAIAEGNKDVSDFLRYEKKVRPMSPSGTGYAQHYDMYREISLP